MIKQNRTRVAVVFRLIYCVKDFLTYFMRRLKSSERLHGNENSMFRHPLRLPEQNFKRGELWIWPIFGLVFQFLDLKTAVFRFWCLVRFVGFLQFSLWFLVFVNYDGGFSNFSAQCILRFF